MSSPILPRAMLQFYRCACCFGWIFESQSRGTGFGIVHPVDSGRTLKPKNLGKVCTNCWENEMAGRGAHVMLAVHAEQKRRWSHGVMEAYGKCPDVDWSDWPTRGDFHVRRTMLGEPPDQDAAPGGEDHTDEDDALRTVPRACDADVGPTVGVADHGPGPGGMGGGGEAAATAGGDDHDEYHRKRPRGGDAAAAAVDDECDWADMLGECVHGREATGRVKAYFPTARMYGILPKGNLLQGKSSMQLIGHEELLRTLEDRTLAALWRGSVKGKWRPADWQ